jgi:hypothetical protein
LYNKYPSNINTRLTPLLGDLFLLLLSSALTLALTVLGLIPLKSRSDILVSLLKGLNEKSTVIEEGKIDKSSKLNKDVVHVLIKARRKKLAEREHTPVGSPFLLFALILSNTLHAHKEGREESTECEKAALSGEQIEHKNQQGTNSHKKIADRNMDLTFNSFQLLYKTKPPKKNTYHTLGLRSQRSYQP